MTIRRINIKKENDFYTVYGTTELHGYRAKLFEAKNEDECYKYIRREAIRTVLSQSSPAQIERAFIQLIDNYNGEESKNAKKCWAQARSQGFDGLYTTVIKFKSGVTFRAEEGDISWGMFCDVGGNVRKRDVAERFGIEKDIGVVRHCTAATIMRQR